MVPLNVFPADPEDEDLLGRIVIHLNQGGLLAYPTETVYGLGAAADLEGVEAVRALKGREGSGPFLVLLPGIAKGPESASGRPGTSIPGGSGSAPGGSASRRPAPGGSVPEAAARWGLDGSPAAAALGRAFWPGPLTLVLSDPAGRFPAGVRSPDETVAVRVSSHPFVQALLGIWDRPLISTSANRPGDVPARSADEVLHAVEGRPGMYRFWLADGGELPRSGPSTVVDCTGAHPRLLREGALSQAVLQEITPELICDDQR